MTSLFYRRLLLLFCLFLFLCTSFSLSASSPTIPITDPVYHQIDQLIGANLIPNPLMGQRPWTRKEVARMLLIAQKHYPEFAKKEGVDKTFSIYAYTIDRTLKHLQKQFKREIKAWQKNSNQRKYYLSPFQSLEMNYTYLDSPHRTIPTSNNLGFIDAEVNPLIQNKNGRHFVSGHNLHWRLSQEAGFFNQITFVNQMGANLLLSKESSKSDDIEWNFDSLYLKWGLKNFEIALGRDQIAWGQGAYGGILFSNNNRNFDMLQLHNPHPLTLPWIFKYLGGTRFNFFLANLGPESTPPRAFLIGFKTTFRTCEWFEVGYSQSLTMGGEGGPDTKWYDPITEFFFIRRGSLRGAGPNVADRRFGLDWRLTIPPWRSLQWYWEIHWDDFGRETWYANLTEQMAFLSGLYLPRVNNSGTLSARLEYQRIPPIFYHHSTWRDGHTLNQHVIGSPLGPDADGLYLDFLWALSPTHDWKFSLAYENRDSDLYTQTTSSKGGADRVVKISNGTTEHRIRFLGQFRSQLTKKMEIRTELGLEQTIHFNFSNNNPFHLLAGLNVKISP